MRSGALLVNLPGVNDANIAREKIKNAESEIQEKSLDINSNFKLLIEKVEKELQAGIDSQKPNDNNGRIKQRWDSSWKNMVHDISITANKPAIIIAGI